MEAAASRCAGSQTRAPLHGLGAARIAPGTPTAPPESASRASRTARPSTSPARPPAGTAGPPATAPEGSTTRIGPPPRGSEATTVDAAGRPQHDARKFQKPPICHREAAYVEDRPSLGRGLAGRRCRRSHQNPPCPTARGGPPPPKPAVNQPPPPLASPRAPL